MDISNAGSVLPQEPPILMLDRLIDVVPGQAGVGIKRFQPEDPCFAGHFPDRPILPGIYLIEAIAQTAMAILGAASADGNKPMGYLAKVDKMSFYQPVLPRQEIFFTVRITRKLGRFYMAEGDASHENVRCARGSLTLAMSEPAAD